jgi:Xaa-Pro aminopeptidase
MDYRRYLEELTSRPIPKETAFPEAEYRRRADAVRGHMAEKGLDALLVTFVPNVCYMTGYHAFAADLFACMVLPIAGEPTLQVTEFEIPGALLSGWIPDIRAIKFTDPDSLSRELAGVLLDRKLDGKRIGIEAKRHGMSIDTYEGLKRALPRATLVDASEVVGRARVVKSAAELDHMRRAAAMTRKGIEAAVGAVVPGATEDDIASVAYATLVKAGSEYFSCQPVIVAGHRTGWIHTSHRGLRVERGHTVMIEATGFHHRYMAPIMHTVSIGPPSRGVERLVNASNDTLELLFETIRPGRTAHDVWREVSKGLRDVRAEAYSTGMFGYSVGLSLPPTWREAIIVIAEGVDQPLRPGMAFYSPVTLRHPGTLGIGFSETLVVTETGCEILTKHDRTLTVVPAA